MSFQITSLHYQCWSTDRVYGLRKYKKKLEKNRDEL